MVTAIYVLATKVSLKDSNGKRLLTYKWTSIALSIFSGSFGTIRNHEASQYSSHC